MCLHMLARRDSSGLFPDARAEAIVGLTAQLKLQRPPDMKKPRNGGGGGAFSVPLGEQRWGESIVIVRW